MEAAIKLTQNFLEGKVDQSHGIEHALSVVEHVEQALKVSEFKLSDREIEAIKLAALLHDVDDRKYFPTSHDLTNAKMILSQLNAETELVLKMINLVSCSKNGNSTEGADHDWWLYPRYADRLEAIGKIGIERCLEYTKQVGRPYFTETTPRPQSVKEIWEIASPERFAKYTSMKGGSATFIDHFYDKVFQVALAMKKVKNPYFSKEAEHRTEVMEEYILKFGKEGTI